MSAINLELNGMGIQFLSQREAIDTEGPFGRAVIVIVSVVAKLAQRKTSQQRDSDRRLRSIRKRR
jgi:hypothetical protein